MSPKESINLLRREIETRVALRFGRNADEKELEGLLPVSLGFGFCLLCSRCNFHLMRQKENPEEPVPEACTVSFK